MSNEKFLGLTAISAFVGLMIELLWTLQLMVDSSNAIASAQRNLYLIQRRDTQRSHTSGKSEQNNDRFIDLEINKSADSIFLDVGSLLVKRQEQTQNELLKQN